MKYTAPAVEHREATAAPYVLGETYQTPTWTDNENGVPMTYERPAVETTEPIFGAFVLGSNYPAPSWTDDESEEST